MDKLIYDMTASDLEGEVLGKRVLDVSESNGTITLEGGVVLRFEDESLCCAWFTGELKKGNLTDNVVTSIVEEDRGEDSEYGTERSYSLHILAADTRIATLDIDGDIGNWYYCSGITLRVYPPKPEG